MSLLFELASIVLLLALSAFFSGSETALLALTEVELDDMERGRSARAKQAAALGRHPHRLLVTVLLGNLTVNVGISVLSTALCVHQFGGAGVWIAIPSVSLLLFVLGDIVPKSLGLRHARQWAPFAAPPIALLAWVLGPIRSVLERLARLAAGTPRPAALSRGELSTMV